MKDVLLDACKEQQSNNLRGHAALLLTCAVLPTAHGDSLLQGLHAKGAINREKARHGALCSVCATVL